MYLLLVVLVTQARVHRAKCWHWGNSRSGKMDSKSEYHGVNLTSSEISHFLRIPSIFWHVAVKEGLVMDQVSWPSWIIWARIPKDAWLSSEQTVLTVKSKTVWMNFPDICKSCLNSLTMATLPKVPTITRLSPVFSGNLLAHLRNNSTPDPAKTNFPFDNVSSSLKIPHKFPQAFESLLSSLSIRKKHLKVS